MIFVNGKADKEFWWSICKCRKCPHHLPHRCISASLTLLRTDGQVMGSLSLIQNVMAWDELLKLEIKMSFIRKVPPWGFLSFLYNSSCADSELCCV